MPRYADESFPSFFAASRSPLVRTRKVTLDAPEKATNQDAVGANLAAVVVGVSVVFIVGLFVPMLFMFAFLGGMLKASRRGRRRW